MSAAERRGLRRADEPRSGVIHRMRDAGSRHTAEDAALFGTLWPLGDVVKLDATVDRRTLREQRDRLGALGYEFEPLSQQWHRRPT